MKKLTIGMATFDDYDGVFFSLQALKMYHPICRTDQIEFIVVDNNPDSAHGKEVKKFTENWIKGKYIPFTDKQSTSTRDEIFKHASGEYTLCIDCHVLIESGGIDELLKYYQNNPDTKNLIQGPLLLDDLKHYYTHFSPVWRDSMFGTWDTNKEAYEIGEPFDIPMQGLGLFSCKTSNWLGFNPKFRGFGGEEGYIHEKFRQNGARCLCLPSLKWMHRFARPNGVKYPLKTDDRVWNYIIGGLELYKDENHPFILSIIDHFKTKFPEKLIRNFIEIAKLNI